MHHDYTMHVNGMAVKIAAQLSTVFIYGNNFVHKWLTEYKERLSIGKNKYHNFKKPNNSGLAIKAESQAERNPEQSFMQSRGAEKGKVRTRDYICPH